MIDDDEVLASEITEVVRATGHRAVRIAPEAYVARRSCAGEDMLILDIVMPGVDGLDVLRKAAGAERAPAIVLISGHGEAVLRGAAVAAERSGLRLAGSLAKPFGIEALTAVLTSVGGAPPETAVASVGASAIRAAVAAAIAEGSLAVAFQPVVRTEDFAFAGAEALLLGSLPGLPDYLSPTEIVRALAADADLLAALTFTVARQAAEACRRWHAAGHRGTVAVNVPARVLREPEAAETLRLIVCGAGLSPSSMSLELIEDDLHDGEAAIVASLVHLRLAGFGLLLDEVGRRESGLLQLTSLPVTGIKIDLDLLKAARHWEKSRRIYAALAHLGARLGLTVTAVGVETDADATFVRAAGVQLVQGFHVSGKLSLADLLATIPRLCPPAAAATAS